MMRSIWLPAMSEHVIASVLRKLGPEGDVSHEEALGGQAIRENAVIYDSLVGAYRRWKTAGKTSNADTALARARNVLAHLDATRENYHMIDDEFQLPVLEARYLSDSSVPAERKRAFLLDSADLGAPRATALLRELALVARETRPYADDPRATNLVGFPRLNAKQWRSASWRDSDAGYGNGRFAMDINAIWVPAALEAMTTVLEALRQIVGAEWLRAQAAPLAGPLATYARDSSALRHAVDAWRGARRHFEVTLSPADIERGVKAKLASLPQPEREYWQSSYSAASDAARDTLRFLALSLDSAGAPIPIVNTDPATGIFLSSSGTPAAAPRLPMRRDVEPFTRPYPVGLFVDRIGPLVSNDTYASPEVWKEFDREPYHGPGVVWGREVSLISLGLANLIARAPTLGAAGGAAPVSDSSTSDLESLRRTLTTIRAATEASGLEHSELWSYRIDEGRLAPSRYGTSSDVQLWSTTDLAVQWMLSRLPSSAR
jgi:hypothetical protein